MAAYPKLFRNGIALSVVVLLVAPAALTFPGYTATISIDCNKTDGNIKPFSEINSGPLPIYYVNGADITPSYRSVGINFIRTHDFYGPTDISTIFPDWNADPSKEESYSFSSSDYYVNGIVDAGLPKISASGLRFANMLSCITTTDGITATDTT